ncbi:unnamed protein product [Brachionus calyciflorus]|uniref:Uncharacterized protein n=1 Tax=Brachionus calyciflorus TaxID=104777 RepID=A0A814G4T0_9BILA|nr:unnamed protein product [Brachionus calyciflorus]
MDLTPSSSSASQTNTAIQVGVGVGVASYSSSTTPFNPRPTSSSINIPCSNRHFYNSNLDIFDSSSSSSPPSSSTYHHSCSNFHSNLTLTLITTTPLTTLTTPLIPIVQQLNTTMTQTASLPSSSNTSILTQNCLINQLPCTSAVSSSSASPSRDWFTYEYKLDNIEDLIKSHETQQGFVQSPTFSFTNHLINSENNTESNSKQPSNWRLILYPNGAGSDCKNFLSIFLKYISDEPVKIQMMFSIVDNSNEDVYVKYTVNKFQKSNDWGFKQLIHKNAILHQKEKFLKENKSLMVRVKMRLDEHKHDYLKKLNDNLHYCKLLSENFSQFYQQEMPSDSNQPSTSFQPSSSSNISSLVSSETNYFDCLLLVKNLENNDKKHKRLCDSDSGVPMSKRVKLDVNNNYIEKSEFVEFKAHKCILAARSPVFKAMFNYKLKENLTNKVIIEDCRPDVVKAMLKYIYTANLPDDVRQIAFDLYIAAEKYFIESLKIKCREYLVENLSLDNCIQIYILSEMYNDSMLRKQSLKFINENIDKVTQNSEWNDFMTNYPNFFTNAFIRICKKDF